MQLKQPQHCPAAWLQYCSLSGHGQDLQRAPRPRGKQIHAGQQGKKHGACRQKQILAEFLCHYQGMVGVR